MAIKLGLTCKLMRGAAGSQATTEMTNVKDVTLNLETGEADVTTRAAKGWRVNAATLKEGSLEFGMNYDTDDEDCKEIMNAFLNGTALSFFVTDGEGSGLDADFVITAFNIEQPLEEAVSVSVTAKPTMSTPDRAPTWVTGGDV